MICDEPFKAYNYLAYKFRPWQAIRATISPDVQIPESTVIEPGVVIARGCKIGEDCHIMAGAIIGEYTMLGNRVNIQPNAIIGSDAFYFKKTDAYTKWRSIGRVILEDDVEIGAGSTVNKGVSGDTIIGQGTKLDCQVHIGHGVVIGKNCLLAGQVGIGGKTIVGDDCTFYGQVGVAQNLTIGDRVILLAKSGVSKDLEADKTYFGAPCQEARTKYKELAALRNLPEFFKNLKK